MMCQICGYQFKHDDDVIWQESNPYCTECTRENDITPEKMIRWRSQ